MRAGSLSDPRVIALLEAYFIPCHISALNTPSCMRDPRDLKTLAGFGRDVAFQGGEREAFILPDGRMLDVFLSMRGTWRFQTCVQMTAAGRRSEYAVEEFRERAAEALEKTHGGLPEDWDAIWSGRDPRVAAIRERDIPFPAPPPGSGGFRVFVRNSYLQYDDLHGCEVVAVDQDAVTSLISGLREVGDARDLPRAVFFDLARAMVPRGQVGTHLRDASIGGELTLRVTSVQGDRVSGVVEGAYRLLPTTREEVSLRDNATRMFESRGDLCGEFTLDRSAGAIRSLRFAAADVSFEWKTGHPLQPYEFPYWHRVAVEWVAPAEEGTK